MGNLEKYFIIFWEIFLKILRSIYRKILIIISKIFPKISRNTSEIFEKYFRKFRKILPKKISSNILDNVENFFGKCWEIYRKISNIWNNLGENFEDIFRKNFADFWDDLSVCSTTRAGPNYDSEYRKNFGNSNKAKSRRKKKGNGINTKRKSGKLKRYVNKSPGKIRN